MVKTHPKSFFVTFSSSSWLNDHLMGINSYLTHSELGLSDTGDSQETVVLQLEGIANTSLMIAEVVLKKDYLLDIQS